MTNTSLLRDVSLLQVRQDRSSARTVGTRRNVGLAQLQSTFNDTTLSFIVH